jgi:hypothetical protein
MTAMLGVVLALSMAASGHNGINGFDPSAVRLIRDLDKYEIDETPSKAVVDWLEADPGPRSSVLKYFVACAFDHGVVIRFRGHVWTGNYGLAPKLQKHIQVFTPTKANPDTDLLLDPDEGKWVSACLMAHANTKLLHQHISIRGSPEVWTGSPPSAGTRWAMGYPEGVFFADLLNFNYDGNGRPKVFGLRGLPDTAALERSFTQSLNRATGCEPPSPLPNVVLGRTLDHDDVTTVTVPAFGTYRVARRLPGRADHVLPGSPQASDPDYQANDVCLVPGDQPATVPCNDPRAEHWKPLFVHLPRMVPLANIETTADRAKIMQSLFAGKPGPSQILPCPVPGECVGPISPVSVVRPPTCPANPPPPTLLAGLHSGQSVTAVLRALPSEEPAGLTVDMKEKFTAIIRYWSKDLPRAILEVTDRTGKWIQAKAAWQQGWEAGEGFRWVQVYPVVPAYEKSGKVRTPVLRVRISGDGTGSAAPELDVAGFVAGKPSCFDAAVGSPRFQVCPESGPRPRPPVRH